MSSNRMSLDYHLYPWANHDKASKHTYTQHAAPMQILLFQQTKFPKSTEPMIESTKQWHTSPSWSATPVEYVPHHNGKG